MGECQIDSDVSLYYIALDHHRFMDFLKSTKMEFLWYHHSMNRILHLQTGQGVSSCPFSTHRENWVLCQKLSWVYRENQEGGNEWWYDGELWCSQPSYQGSSGCCLPTYCDSPLWRWLFGLANYHQRWWHLLINRAMFVSNLFPLWRPVLWTGGGSSHGLTTLSKCGKPLYGDVREGSINNSTSSTKTLVKIRWWYLHHLATWLRQTRSIPPTPQRTRPANRIHYGDRKRQQN